MEENTKQIKYYFDNQKSNKITSEELKESDIKTYFDSKAISENDNALFCYFMGDVIRKAEFEYEANTDNLTDTIRKDIVIEKTKVVLNFDIIEIICDNLNFIEFNEADNLPIFEIKSDVDVFYGKIKHKTFINELTRVFGKELVDSIDMEYSSYQQEVFIYLLNVSYQRKFETFLYDVYAKANPTVIIQKLVKYNVIDEDVSVPFYMYNLIYNENTEGFNQMYQYMNDLKGLKKVEKGADLIKEYFGYTEEVKPIENN